MVQRVAGGKPLPEAIQSQIVGKADGVPLFIEELTKAVLEADWLVDQGDRHELAAARSTLNIPATLHDSLMARLDRLIPVKEVAQIGAAIGREFSYEMLASSSSPLRPTRGPRSWPTTTPRRGLASRRSTTGSEPGTGRWHGPLRRSARPLQQGGGGAHYPA